MKKRILSIMLSVIMVLGMMPLTALPAFAEESGQPHVSYRYYDADANAFHKAVYTHEYTTVESTTTTWPAGWYVADGTVVIDDAVSITGDVMLILKDGCKLTVNGGIHLGFTNLTIYGQSAGTGELIAFGGYDAAIGGLETKSFGSVNICGGTITATANGGGAAIGEGYYSFGGPGTVNIYGGTVNATGCMYGAAIGGGDDSAGHVNIYGGTVNATAGTDGAAIGGGQEKAGYVNIYGGTVNAAAKDGAAIGGGSRGEGYVNIYGGTVSAVSGIGAAIGNGEYLPGDHAHGAVNINGGTVSAASGKGAGIGGGEGGDACTVTIISGDVTASSEEASGVGAGYEGTTGTVTIAEGLSVYNLVTDIPITKDSQEEWSSVISGVPVHITDPEFEPSPAPVWDTDYTEIQYMEYTDGSLVSKTYKGDVYYPLNPYTVELTDNWYAFDGEITLTEKMPVNGDVKLILNDGSKMNALGGFIITEGSSLTIYGQTEGTGELIVGKVSENNAAINVKGSLRIDGGKVTANGGTNGAGIGGGNQEKGGNVTINGGTVTAHGGTNGAGIGGGNQEKGGTVTINGGTVRAIGGTDASAIGGGARGDGGFLTINDGSVIATGGSGSCIGGGGAAGFTKGGAGGTVIINGGTVEASNTAAIACVGIGGGENAYGGDITINGGTVTAGGIGGGNNIEGGKVIINGGVVTTKGFSYAGIGGGYLTNGVDVTITGGTVNATGGKHCAGIGGGSYGNGGNVKIDGGTVIATGGSGAAGIGGGYSDVAEGIYGNGGNVTINGGTVTATGGSGAAGIGAGTNGGTGGTLTITDGTVKAYSSSGSAAIGGGSSDTAVDIYGGDITADSKSDSDAVIADSITIYPDKCEVFTLTDLSDNELSGSPVTQEKNIISSISGYNGIHIISEFDHKFDGEYVDNEDGTHSLVCSACDALSDAENHTFKYNTSENHICICGATQAHTWQSIDAQTHECTACGAVGDHTDANSDYECDACGYILCTHNDTSVVYNWNGNYTSCTAVLHCNTCGRDIDSETSIIIELIESVQGNCITKGKGYYEATFENYDNGVTESIFDTVIGPHCYVDGYCKYCTAEQPLKKCKAEAIQAITDAAGDSTEFSVMILTAGAKVLIDSAESVPDVIKIRNESIAGIEKLTAADPHEHTYSAEWNFDENYHWHSATCEHSDLVSGFAAHTFGENNKCTVCGYEDTGIRAKVCTVILTSLAEPDRVLYSGTTDGTNICNIGNVANGTYRMSVSCEGAVTRTYTTEITDGEVTQEVALYAEGDVNGDGEIDVNDYALAVNTALGEETEVAEDLTATADYQKAVADLDKDGFVDVLDIALLERKIHI